MPDSCCGPGLRLRPPLHVGVEARHSHRQHRARRARSAVAAGRTELAVERAALRRTPGAEQGRNRRQARRRPGQDLAPRLRDCAAAAGRRRFAPSVARPALQGFAPSDLPLTESLKDTVARFLPYWQESIAPPIKAGKRVLIAAHGNSLRALVKYLDHISDEEIVELNIPTGIPLVYELDDDLKPLRHYYLGRSARLRGGPPRQ